MGIFRDLLGGASRADCDAYRDALNAREHVDSDDPREIARLDRAEAKAAARLPRTVRYMVEDGRY